MFTLYSTKATFVNRQQEKGKSKKEEGRRSNEQLAMSN
jgi:hypothetical protein